MVLRCSFHGSETLTAAAPQVAEDMYLEPTTGRIYSVTRCPYLKIDLIWNHRNLWVNMQAQLSEVIWSSWCLMEVERPCLGTCGSDGTNVIGFGCWLDPYWIHIGSIKGPFIAAVLQRIARCVALLTCSLICTTRGTSSMSCGASQSDQSSGAAWRFWNMTWDTLWETWQFAIENGHWNSEFSH
jgi:hypothetical protein